MSDNSTTIYQRLGDYIREVDVRNKDLAVERLLGVSISKEFMPSIANTIGTDMSNYKVVEGGQFAYGPVTSRNGDKVSIALLHAEKAIISQAYTVFEVVDKEKLLPQYLMMWFRRPEFDRYARFHSHGSAREVFDWEEMCEVRLPIPPIARQREIVEEYETLSRRIRLCEDMILRLEATAQALYHKMFVNNIAPNNLPQGWRMGTLGDVAEVSSGKTCVDKSAEQNDIYKHPIAGAAGVIGYSSTFNKDEDLLTIGRVGTLGIVNRYHGKTYMADNVLVVKSEYYEYCYQLLHLIDYNEITKGGVQSLITQTDLKNTPAIIPSEEAITLFETDAKKISNVVDGRQSEIFILNSIQSLLLTHLI